MADRKFNFRKLVGVSSCITVMTLMLTNFQNCAPPQVASEAIEDYEIRIVEDWTENKLRFMQSELTVKSDSNAVSIYGLCDRKADGEHYDITLSNANNDVIFIGDSICNGGGFEVTLELDSEPLECDSDYSLFVSDEIGKEDEMTLKVSCKI